MHKKLLLFIFVLTVTLSIAGADTNTDIIGRVILKKNSSLYIDKGRADGVQIAVDEGTVGDAPPARPLEGFEYLHDHRISVGHHSELYSMGLHPGPGDLVEQLGTLLRIEPAGPEKQGGFQVMIQPHFQLELPFIEAFLLDHVLDVVEGDV